MYRCSLPGLAGFDKRVLVKDPASSCSRGEAWRYQEIHDLFLIWICLQVRVIDPGFKPVQTGCMKDVKKIAIFGSLAIAIVGGFLLMFVRYQAAQRTPEMLFIEELYRKSLDVRAQNTMNAMKVSSEGKEVEQAEPSMPEVPVNDEAKNATSESKGLTRMTTEELKTYFSQEFQTLWEENMQICISNAVGEDCGWEGNGDILLDAQEVDPELTFDSAMVRVVRFSEGFYEANFNIFPKDLQGGKLKPQHDRRVRFWIKQENGKFVIDNIAYVYPNLIEDARERMKIDQETYGKK